MLQFTRLASPTALMLLGATSMRIYYLYIKTHNVTGLKYLGQTLSTDPHKYKGSGSYWNQHIKKHGYNCTTEILKECNTTDDLKYWGLYYSDFYNVVNAVDDNGKKLWANLEPESGPGTDPDTARKSALKRVKNGTHNFQGDKNPSHKRVREGKHNFQGDTNLNHKRIKEGNHNLQGKNNPVHALYARNEHWIQSDIGRTSVGDRQRELLATGKHPLQGDNNPNRIKVRCPHCNKVGGKTSMQRWHFDNCKLSPNYTGPKFIFNRAQEICITCPHCNKQGRPSNMSRWHFDKCKFKCDAC